MNRARKIGTPDFIVHTPGHVGRGKGGRPKWKDQHLVIEEIDSVMDEIGDLVIEPEPLEQSPETVPMPTGRLPVEGGGQFEPLEKWTEEDEV